MAKSMLMAVLVTCAVCLTSCERDSAVYSTGTGVVHLDDSHYGYCYAVNEKLVFVIYLTVSEGDPSPVARPESATKNGVASHQTSLVLEHGHILPVEYSSARPQVVEIGLNEYPLHDGRVFLANVVDGVPKVEQISVEPEWLGDSSGSVRKLAQENERIRTFLSLSASTE